ncbi:Hippocampus abundant transcript 1 protein [Dissophora ornata]|nr:Hippocampus abundant transcript 1 protein [Dissophora ornata]
MSNIEEPLIAETTALLGSSTAPAPREYRPPTWYWPWQPRYWAAIPVIFLAGLAIGPAIALSASFIKVLFCERGIPKYFATSNSAAGDIFSLSGDHPSEGNRCDSAEYSAAIAKFFGIYASLSAILVTLTVRFWSTLGDRIGRKRVMLIWAVGTALSQTMPLLVYYNKGTSVYFLWLGGMIEGAVGSVPSVIALTHAYAADVTRPDDRTVVFGRMISGWYAGLGLGAAFGGVIAKKFGLIAAYWMMPTLVVLDVIYIMLMPESLDIATLAHNNNKSARLASSQSRSTLIAVDRPDRTLDSEHAPYKDSKFHHGRFVDFIKSLMPEQLPNRIGGKYSVMMLMVTCFLGLTAVMGAAFQISNYLLYRFQWSEAKLSAVGAIQGLSRLVALTVFLPLIKRLGPKNVNSDPVVSIDFDLKVVIFGLLVESLTMFIYAITTVGEGFYLGGMTGAIGSMFFPAIRGILSQSVAPALLGKTLGTLATFESLSLVVAPSLFAWFYGVTLESHPSAVFYAASVLVFFAAVLAGAVFVTHRRSMKHGV